MNFLNLKELLPKSLHSEIDILNSEFQMLQYKNKTLVNQLGQSEEKIKDLTLRVEVLLRQTDEWAKSYDNLLNNFVQFRMKKDN